MSAAIRLANSLLRGVGGRQVLLRIPAPATQGDTGEQLGLGIPQFQDAPLRPCAFRRVRAHVTPACVESELLVSATAVVSLVGSLDYQSASVLFGCAAGVLIDDVLYTITSVASAEAFGEVYLYRLGLRSPINGLL